MLTFDPLSNSTVHATFDLREVHNVESLNITLELPDSMAVVMGDNAWATFSVAAPSNTVIHPSSTMNPFPSVTVGEYRYTAFRSCGVHCNLYFLPILNSVCFSVLIDRPAQYGSLDLLSILQKAGKTLGVRM